MLNIQDYISLSAGVLYFVSATVNPILYNVMSRKYRQAFKMTLCYPCMDDESRQRLHRDGFGASTVYFSTAPFDGDPLAGKNRRPTWRNSSSMADTSARQQQQQRRLQPFGNDSSSSREHDQKTPSAQASQTELTVLTSAGSGGGEQLRYSVSLDGADAVTSRKPTSGVRPDLDCVPAVDALVAAASEFNLELLKGRLLQVPHQSSGDVGLQSAEGSCCNSTASSQA